MAANYPWLSTTSYRPNTHEPTLSSIPRSSSLKKDQSSFHQQPISPYSPSDSRNVPASNAYDWQESREDHYPHATPMQSTDSIALETQRPKDDFNRNLVDRPHYERQASDTFPLNPTQDRGDRRRRKAPSRNKRYNVFGKRIPWVTYTLSLIQISVFIAELVKMSILTGSPIATKPFNPMIGPSPNLLINMGARYVPCMRNTDGIQNSHVAIAFPCPNTTATNVPSCTLSEVCGFNGVPPVDPTHPYTSLNEQPAPNQWFRFITPIFLHGGIIHISGNLLLQLLLGRDMEKVIGAVRFTIIYFSSGIFGFVMGGNFAAAGLATTGCSGCLMGIVALVVLDLIYTWKVRKHAVQDLIFLLFMIVFTLVLGLLPTGTDNFAHIGGFLTGLVLGLCVLHSPSSLRKQVQLQEADPGINAESGTVLETNGKNAAAIKVQPASSDGLLYGTQGMPLTAYIRNPRAFFHDRKPLWWAWWFIRAAALVTVLACFIILLNNFYKYRSQCTWCKYLTCIPVNNWCNMGQLSYTSDNSTASTQPTSIASLPSQTAMI